MSQVQAIELWVEIEGLNAVLDEARSQVLPVVFRVEIVLSIDVLVDLVDGRQLSHLQVRNDPGDVGVVLYNLIQIVINLAVVNCHHFLQRVGVVLEESIQGRGQHVGSA